MKGRPPWHLHALLPLLLHPLPTPAASDQVDCPTLCSCAHVEGRLTADCASKNLTEIPPGLPSNAMALVLDDNLLPHLNTPGLFANFQLHSLVTLRLARARITHIGPEVFDNLPILETMDLSHNLLSAIEFPIFDGLAKLTKLDLSYNHLEEVTPNMFTGAPMLEEIRLEGNRIRFIYQEAFQELFRLKVVSLQRNDLIRLERNIFHRLPSLQLLDLRHNPWICDCMLREFFLWQQELYLSEPPVCAAPGHMEGRSWDRAEPDEFACPPEFLHQGELGLRSVRPLHTTFLTCAAKGDPQPRVAWTLKPANHTAAGPLPLDTKVHGGRFSFHVRPVQLTPHAWNYSLRIEHVHPMDVGTYVCTLSNKAGTEMEIFQLALREPLAGEGVGSGEDSLLERLQKSGKIWLVLIIGATLGIVLLILLIIFSCYRLGLRRRLCDHKAPGYVSVNGYGYQVIEGGGQDKATGPAFFSNDDAREGDTPTPRPLTSLRHPDPDGRGMGQDDSGYLEEGRGSPPPLHYKAPMAQSERGSDMKMPLRETAL